MKTRPGVLTLVFVAALAALGAWVLYRTTWPRTRSGEEIADRPAIPGLHPPVLRGSDAEPAADPEPAAPSAPPLDLGLSVWVLDDEGGRVLEGAEVLVVQGEDPPRAFKANHAGVAAIGGLRTGDARVVARAPGFVRAEVHLDLRGDEPAVLELRLQRGVVLEGTVVATRTGLAVAGASVTVVPGGSLDGWTEMSVASPFGSTRTDDRGRFVVDGVAPGALVTARATAEGHGAAMESMRLAPAPDTPPTVVLRLPPAAALTGSVRRPGGESAAGARVYAVPADAPEMLLADPETHCISNGRPFRSLRAVAESDGTFHIQGLELGALYTVFAELEGHGRSQLEKGVVATEEDPRPHVALVLRGAASLTVRVWSPEGEPQEEGRLSLFGEGFPLDLELLSAGVFVAREPVPGTYTLRVTCPGTVMQELPVEIRAAEQEAIEVRLARGLVLAGVLVDDTGRPIPGQKLWVDRPWKEAGKHPPSRGAAESDAEGRFEIRGLREGPHTLGLVLGRHVIPDDLRLMPPDSDLRVVALRKAVVRLRLGLPVGFAPPERVAIRIGRVEDGGYGESGHSVPWEGGEVRFDDLVPGSSRLRIQVEGLLEAVRELTLEPGEVADLGAVALEAGFELEGRIVDREDRPVTGARVAAGEVWTPTHRTVTADADGRFVLQTLARGPNDLEITAAGFVRRSVKVLVPDESSGRSFVLDRGCLVAVRVLDGDGRPAPARRVRWRRAPAAGESDGEDSSETDARGRLEVRLGEGRWTIEVLDDEWSPVTAREVDLTEGGTATVEIDLPR